MTEKQGDEIFSVIKGDIEHLMELSSALQSVLKKLPDGVDALINREHVLEKKAEVLLWSNQELIEYLSKDNLFADAITAITTWAVMDVAKSKLAK